MELRELRSFLAAAEDLHFGRAARRTHLTQSALSKQVRRLEAELGCELFLRQGRQVRLAPAGQALLDRARRILALADDCPSLVRRAQAGRIGVLDVAYVPSSDIRILPPILRRFRRRHPEIEVRLHQTCTPDVLEGLRSSRLDVGLVHLPAEAPDVTVEPVCKEPLVLVVPHDHPLARHSRIGIQQLQDVPYVFFPRTYAPVYHDLVTSVAQNAGVSLRVEVEARTVYDNLSLIAAGLGVSLLPSSIQDLPRKGLTFRRFSAPDAEIKMGIAWRKDVRLPARDLFTRCVRQTYRMRVSGPPPCAVRSPASDGCGEK